MAYLHGYYLPPVRSDLIAAATFPGTPQPQYPSRWLPQGGKFSALSGTTIPTAIRSLKNSNPLYYNSLMDKYTRRHLTKPGVHSHLHKCGFISEDGTVCPTRLEQIEANRAYRLQGERDANLRAFENREKARLHRLRKAAAAGDVTFTRDGIYETKPCLECGFKHKVASVMSNSEVCPGSQMANHGAPHQLEPLPKNYRKKRSGFKKVSHVPMEAFLMCACCNAYCAHAPAYTSAY